MPEQFAFDPSCVCFSFSNVMLFLIVVVTVVNRKAVVLYSVFK